MIGGWELAAVAVVVLAIRRYSADIYDVLIVHMTARWYAAVLARMKRGERLFDVGIGTASALVRNASVVRSREVRDTSLGRIAA